MAFKPIGRLLIIDKGGTNFVECILDNERVELGRCEDAWPDGLSDRHVVVWRTRGMDGYIYICSRPGHRRPDCHITINSRSVSRTSVVFEYNQDTNSTWVTSVGSNLVTVDKQEMQRHQQVELKPGAVIEARLTPPQPSWCSATHHHRSKWETTHEQWSTSSWTRPWWYVGDLFVTK